MPREAIRPSAALGALLRARRTELGLSLGEVSDRTRRRGEGIPATTIARIERGESDPGVLRLIALLRFYDIPVQSALDLVEVREMSGVAPPTGDLPTLLAQGLEAFRKGDMQRGLAHWYEIAERPLTTDEERLIAQKARLSLSIAASNLGRVRLSLQLVEALLLEPPHPSILVNTLIHAAVVWERLGSRDMAHALLDRAARVSEKELAPSVAVQADAWIRQLRAKLLAHDGELPAARAELEAALASFEAAGDKYGHVKARLLRVTHRMVEGGSDALLAEACRVAEAAGAQDQGHAAAWARYEVGKIRVERGEADEAAKVLRSTLAHAVEHAMPDLEFFCHFYLARAFDAQGDAERAQVELESARYYARFVDEICPEKDELAAAPGRRMPRAVRQRSRKVRRPH